MAWTYALVFTLENNNSQKSYLIQVTVSLPVGLVPVWIEGVIDDSGLGEFCSTQNNIDEGISHVLVVDLLKRIT